MAKEICKPETSGKVGAASASPRIRPQARMLDSRALAAKSARAKLSPEERKELDERLISSAYAGDLFYIERLLDAGADVSAKRDGQIGFSTPLTAATEGDKPRVVDFLIDRGAVLDEEDSLGYTALYRAAAFSRSEIARLLIDAGADLEVRGMVETTPLMRAAAGPLERDTEIVKMLLEAGADVFAKDAMGHTALDYATSPETIAILKAAEERSKS